MAHSSADLVFPCGEIVGSESITIDNTAGGVALTSSAYTKQFGNDPTSTRQATYALITVEDHPIRINLNPAVDVTATAHGHLLIAGQSALLTHTAEIVNFRAIRTSGSSGVIRVTYFR